MEVADVDVARVARLLGDQSRAAMLTALLDGRAYPAAALAQVAGIGRPAASEHLQQLVSAGLIEVFQQGRHRYHRITRAEVAHAIEALAAIAPPVPVRSLKQSTTARRLGVARTCYDHLAGRAGVALRSIMLDHGILTAMTSRGTDGQGTLLEISEDGAGRIASLGIDLGGAASRRRRLVVDCLDWTERTPHLAGSLPAALLTTMIDQGWVVDRGKRRIDVPVGGWAQLQLGLGCSGTCHPSTTFTMPGG
ncbi:winged helix-turn-helix domain-containing protein [Actinoplanes sp. NPDC051861]|uniref:ArsR/SmtB family transcription factor n=1 Tax=Actinoplanes sp. NPDC051861 TaxID=3155170 RepID=UPI003431EE79